MKRFEEVGEIGTVAGVEQKPPIPFEYVWDEFENVAEMDSTKARPSEEDILSFRNGLAKRNALSASRAKAQADALALIQDTREYKVAKLAKDIAASSGKSLADSTAIAESLVKQ